MQLLLITRSAAGLENVKYEYVVLLFFPAV